MNQMLNYSEEDVKKAADLREWLIKQISDKQEEIDKLRNLLVLIDNLLKQESFKPASTLERSPILYDVHRNTGNYFVTENKGELPSLEKSQTYQNINNKIRKEENKEIIKEKKNIDYSNYETKELKRLKDNLLLAIVKVYLNYIEITPEKTMSFNINTPPFKSFFIKRIIEGMVNQDQEKVRKKQIEDREMLKYEIKETNGIIKKIVISNYREKERLTDIFNTAAWVFTRMLEKSSG
ncbi:MAG: hypothetical protein R3321_10310 [Nitrososphaeraceae archaeon]|nr:hypothetical protein [Nitrososphaeraceae archaeon]